MTRKGQDLHALLLFIVLAYGLELKKVLEASGSVDVVMTRSDDRFRKRTSWPGSRR